jgi:hypothetical protein
MKKIIGIFVMMLLIGTAVLPATGIINFEKIDIKKTLISGPTIEWAKTYGGPEFDEFRWVQQTSDGGYIMCGSTQESSNHYPWILKVDSDGDEVWNRTITGFDYYGNYYDILDTYCEMVIEATDGGYITCMMLFVNYNEIEYSLGGLVKLDSNGAEEWIQIYGDEFEWTILPHAIMEVDAGFMCVGAHSPPFPSGDTDRAQCLFKIDSSGELLWHKEYNYGERPDWARGICSIDDGFVVVGNVITGPNELDAWMIKTDSQGVEQWSKIFNFGETDVFWKVLQTSDGGFITSGYIGEPGREDGCVVKTDANGNEQWNKIYGGSKMDACLGLDITDDGGFYFGVLKNMMELGGTKDDIWIIKADSMGNTEWSDVYGGSDAHGVRSIDKTSDGGLIAAGYSGMYFQRRCDAILVKYSEFNNQRPDKPSTPTGPKRGKPDTEYTFSTNTVTDPDDDAVMYKWDWGDGNYSDLLDSTEASYTWSYEDNFEVCVMAVDEHGGESDWSDPMPFSTPKNKAKTISFIEILQRFLIRYRIFNID